MHEIFRNSKTLKNNFLSQGEKKSVRGNQFKIGISSPQTFNLGDKFLENVELSNSSLKFILASEVYYGKQKFKEKGQSISYYGQEKSWNDNISKGKAEVSFDFRDAIYNSEKFYFNKINDGHGNYGENCILNLTATYETN